MTIPMNSGLLNTIARQAATSGVVVQAQAGQVSVEGNKVYGFAWLKNCVSSDARKANVELKQNFLAQLKSEFNLTNGHIETIAKRLGRTDTPLDLEQAKSIIGRLRSGEKNFKTPSENLSGLKTFFTNYVGLAKDSRDFTRGGVDKAAERASLNTHVDTYLDAMDARRAEARPGESIPPRTTLKMQISGQRMSFMTPDIRTQARDEMVKLTDKGVNRLELGEGLQKIGGRDLDDVVADRLVDKMKAKADQLQEVTTQSKTDELRLNRMERLFGIPVTTFDRQITPTKNAPNTFA